MLILSRHTGQSIQIGDSVTLTVTEIRRGGREPTVRLGIEAPRNISIVRTELLEDSDVARDSKVE